MNLSSDIGGGDVIMPEVTWSIGMRWAWSTGPHWGERVPVHNSSMGHASDLMRIRGLGIWTRVGFRIF